MYYINGIIYYVMKYIIYNVNKGCLESGMKSGPGPIDSNAIGSRADT